MPTTRPGKKGGTPQSPRQPGGAEDVPVQDDSGISSILAGYESQPRGSPARVQQPAIRAATVGDSQTTGGLFDLQPDPGASSASPATTTSFQVVEEILQKAEEEDEADKAKESSKESSQSSGSG